MFGDGLQLARLGDDEQAVSLWNRMGDIAQITDVHR
jgi:hypothetical protein